MTDVEKADAVLRSGNPFDMLRLALNANKKTPHEIVEETVGSVMYLYYLFIECLHARPVDIDDMVDGLLFLDARQRIRENGNNN